MDFIISCKKYWLYSVTEAVFMDQACFFDRYFFTTILKSVLWVKFLIRDKIMTGRNFGGNVNLIVPL